MVQKCPLFVNVHTRSSYHRKCQGRGVGGQKKPKSCQRSLWTTPKPAIYFITFQNYVIKFKRSIANLENESFLGSLRIENKNKFILFQDRKICFFFVDFSGPLYSNIFHFVFQVSNPWFFSSFPSLLLSLIWQFYYIIPYFRVCNLCAGAEKFLEMCVRVRACVRAAILGVD